MLDQTQTVQSLAGLSPKWALGRFGFAVALLAVEAAIIVLLALVTGVGYHHAMYGDAGDIVHFASIGALTSLLFALPVVFRDEYKFQDFLEGKRAPSRTFMLWNTAFLCLAVVGFLTKTTGIFSRGWLVVFYVVGLCAVISLDATVAPSDGTRLVAPWQRSLTLIGLSWLGLLIAFANRVVCSAELNSRGIIVNDCAGTS